MAREIITIECTEARKEGKSPSRYTTTRNKNSRPKSWRFGNTTPRCAAARFIVKSNNFYATQDTSGKTGGRGGTRQGFTMEVRTPRPKPKIDFTFDALDYKNVTLLKQFVTDQGRILPRKYTGLPAHYQRQLNRSIKRARQMLLMKLFSS
jgi:small subunit ribosomal protein S18